MSLSIFPCLLIAAVFAALLILMALKGKQYKINGFWMFLSIAVAAAGLLVTVVASDAGTIIARPSGDPQQEISGFMESIRSGDYHAAYARLLDYSSLGLEEQPSTEAAQAVYAALRSSYEFELVGECRVDKLSAVQDVRMRYLDISSTGDDIEKLTMKKLEEIVKSRPRNQVYDANSQYLPEVANEAYLSAVREIMANPDKYYTDAEFELSAVYSDGSWKIITAPAMLKALNGGAGY